MLPIGTYLAAAGLIVVLAVVIALPLLERKAPAVEPPSAADSLDLERRTALRAIRELDEDFRTGKLAEADYRTLRAEQVKRGADALRRMSERGAMEAEDRPPDDPDAAIETEILAYRRGRGKAKAGRACPSCGRPVLTADAFCAHCGARLQTPAR